MQNRTLPFYLEDRTGHVGESDFDDMYDRLFLRVCSHASIAAPPFARTSSSSSALSTLSEESCPSSTSCPDPTTFAIYNTGRRSSTREYLSGRRTSRSPQPPSAVLEFGRHGALGVVVLCAGDKGPERKFQMGQWLRKTGMFSGSLSRKFTGTDGREYKWIHRPSEGSEWMLVTAPSSLTVPSATLSSSPTSSFLSSSPISSSPLSSSPSSMSSMPEPREVVVATYTLKPPTKAAYNTSGNVLMISEAWGGLAVEILTSLLIMRHIAAHGL